MITQNEEILAWLKVKSITPIEALEQFGCFRLSARIKDLKNMGHDIVTEMVKLRSGKRCARYRLI